MTDLFVDFWFFPFWIQVYWLVFFAPSCRTDRVLAKDRVNRRVVFAAVCLQEVQLKLTRWSRKLRSSLKLTAMEPETRRCSHTSLYMSHCVGLSLLLTASCLSAEGTRRLFLLSFTEAAVWSQIRISSQTFLSGPSPSPLLLFFFCSASCGRSTPPPAPGV